MFGRMGFSVGNGVPNPKLHNLESLCWLPRISCTLRFGHLMLNRSREPVAHSDPLCGSLDNPGLHNGQWQGEKDGFDDVQLSLK